MCKVNYIAIIPFERTSDDKIKAIYGVELQNHATGQRDTTLLVDSVDPARDQTTFDTVCRALLEEAGLNIEEVGLTEDDIFYLGDITSSLPVSSKFKCYAIDLSKLSKPNSQIEFTRTLSKSSFEKDSSEIVKLGFHQVVNGDFSDATILAASFLLVSYFN
jgi:8-oxo-dGTP pyrophosphatase MutT (NUDIX family)